MTEEDRFDSLFIRASLFLGERVLSCDMCIQRIVSRGNEEGNKPALQAHVTTRSNFLMKRFVLSDVQGDLSASAEQRPTGKMTKPQGRGNSCG